METCGSASWSSWLLPAQLWRQTRGQVRGLVAPDRTCPTCERVFVNERSLSKHLARKNLCLPAGQLKHHCSHCDLYFDKRPLINQHYKTRKHASAVERANGGVGGGEVPEDISGCEVCEIDSFRTEIAKTAHFKSTKHLKAVQLAAGEDVPGCDVCGHATFLSERARASHLLTKSHRAAAERQEKRLSEEGDGCDVCGIERFRSEAARAAHLLTKSHLDAAESVERREQRRLGHRVRGRTNKARAARELACYPPHGGLRRRREGGQ